MKDTKPAIDSIYIIMNVKFLLKPWACKSIINILKIMIPNSQFISLGNLLLLVNK